MLNLHIKLSQVGTIILLVTYINAGKGWNEKMCVIGFKLITHILNYMNSNIIAKKHKSRKS